MYPRFPWWGARRCLSQAGIHYLVKVGSHGAMINWRQQMPPGEQGLRGQRLTTDGVKLGHSFASSGDCYLLALSSSIDHFAAMIPQLPDRDFRHVGHCITRDTNALARPCGATGCCWPEPR